MKKVTENVRNVLGVLANLPEGAGFAREVLAKVEGKTFNSVNATLAAAAGAGWATKAKAVYEDKMLTKYTITEAGRAVLEAPAEAPVEDKEEAQASLFLLHRMGACDQLLCEHLFGFAPPSSAERMFGRSSFM